MNDFGKSLVLNEEVKMLFRFLLCFYFMESYGIYARTEQEIKAWFFREGIECNKEHPISVEEMSMLKEHKWPDSKNVNCLVSCIFKRTGMFNSKGMFDVEASIAMTEKDFADKPKKLENSKKLLEACRKVNNEAVTDGEAGCDRSVLLYKCFHETAPQVGVILP